MSRRRAGALLKCVGLSLLLLFPWRLRAQMSNGTTTVRQETCAGTGGSVSGSGVSLVTVAAEPFGGWASGMGETVWMGYQASLRALPPGTRTINVAGTVTDATTTSVTVNGIPGTVTSATFQANGIQLVEGPNTITAIIADAAGNQTTKSMTVYLDTQPPARPTVVDTPGVTTATSYTLTGTKLANTSLWINGAQIVALDTATTWSYTASLAEGDNTFVVVTKDAAGNTSTSATTNIVVDNLAPVVTFQPPTKTNFNPVTLTGSVDDSLTTVKINNVTANRSGKSFDVSVPLTLGANTLTLIATSPRGLVTQRTYTMTLGTMPTIQTTTPPDGTKLYAAAAKSLQLTATDAEGDAIEYQLLVDGVALGPWSTSATQSWTPTLSQLGLHTLTFSARDAYGGARTKDSEIYVVRQPIAHP